MNLSRFLLLLFAIVITYSFSSCTQTACDACDLEPDPGFCRAIVPKYYFDKNENKCKEFIWGGCLGVVPFDSLEECEACGC